MSDAELLEIGAGGRAGRRAGPPRLVWLVLLVVVAVVAGGALLVDHQMRAREDRAIASCAGRVDTAVALAGRRIQATYEYVRSSFGLVSARGHSEGLYRLIAKSARHSGGALSAARSSCASIDVLPLHDDLQLRRDQCVDVLDAQRSRLAAVAADGTRVVEWMEAPRSC